MESADFLRTSVFIFLPLLFLLRALYAFFKIKHYGTQKISIFTIARLNDSTNPKLVLIARFVIGVSIVGYSVIIYAIVLYRMNS